MTLGGMHLDPRGVRPQDGQNATLTIGKPAMKGCGGAETLVGVPDGMDTPEVAAKGRADLQCQAMRLLTEPHFSLQREEMRSGACSYKDKLSSRYLDAKISNRVREPK